MTAGLRGPGRPRCSRCWPPGFPLGVLAWWAGRCAIRSRVGILVGLIAAKTLGVLGGTWLVARFTRAHLDEGLGWIDVLGLDMLAGIGFTVPLFITDLAFGPDTAQADHAKTAVLAGSLAAAGLSSVLLHVRERTYRRRDAAAKPQPREAVPIAGR